jgi:sulfur carrier protein
MTIRLNGERTDSGDASTVADIVLRYNLPADAILIEHNGVALHRSEWAQCSLGENDRLEFIRVVAGG